MNLRLVQTTKHEFTQKTQKKVLWRSLILWWFTQSLLFKGDSLLHHWCSWRPYRPPLSHTVAANGRVLRFCEMKMEVNIHGSKILWNESGSKCKMEANEKHKSPSHIAVVHHCCKCDGFKFSVNAKWKQMRNIPLVGFMLSSLSCIEKTRENPFAHRDGSTR